MEHGAWQTKKQASNSVASFRTYTKFMRWQSGVSNTTVVQSEVLSSVFCLRASGTEVDSTATKAYVHEWRPSLISGQS